VIDAVAVTLPGGIFWEGELRRDATLRQVTGADEDFLNEACRSMSPAARTTALLARCLRSLGPCAPVTSQAVRSLAAGDREALLLHLRRLTLGDQITCALTCPRADCAERMDLEIAVSDLLLEPYPSWDARHEVLLDGTDQSSRVRFRLANGADQEAVAALARQDEDAAAALLLDRCIEGVAGEAEPAAKMLAPTDRETLSRLMAELDPQAEVRLELTCPACGVRFTALLDTASYFFQELAGRPEYLYREVHGLALHYHWSEAEILALSRRKRRLYLGLLAEALGGGGDG